MATAPVTKTKQARKDASRALVEDSFKRYLSDIRRHPILTKPQEFDLAQRVKAGEPGATAELVNCNLRLVVKIALEYQSTRMSVLDLIQEGNVGLLQAVRKFDPERNIRLSTYAQFWIRAYILKFLMDNYKLVKVGTTQAQRKLFYNLKKEKERMLQQGLEPSAEALARRLDVREKDIVEMETRLSGREISLDAPVNSEDDSGTLMDLIPGNGHTPDEIYDHASVSRHLRGRLSEFRKGLRGRDCDIWDRRLVSEDPLTLQQLGDLFGVSRERARQLEARIVKNLGKFLNEDGEYLEAMNLNMALAAH